MKFLLWDKKTDITLPSGRVLNPEKMFEEFPFSKTILTVLGYHDEEMNIVGDIDPLPVARGLYKIDNKLSDEEAVAEIERIRNEPVPAPPPEAMPASKEDVGFLLQQITELDLTMREARLL